jgi:glycosidase
MMATRNNLSGVKTTGRYRTINRKKWGYNELIDQLSDPDTNTARIFSRMKEIITARKKHHAFHPFGGQKVYDLGHDVFCIERWDPDQVEHVLVLANVTNRSVTVEQPDNVPIDFSRRESDILSGRQVGGGGAIQLEPYEVIWIKI